MTILITGATGFLGTNLCHQLIARKYEIKVAIRSRSISRLPLSLKKYYHIVEEFDYKTRWPDALSGVKSIIHCAARTNLIYKTEDFDLDLYRAVNVEGTKNLAIQAAAAGVKRFIFISSVKVNGEQTFSGSPFTSQDRALPQDAYSISKWEAEQALHQVAVKTNLEVVIIRPPLIYGPGVKGNFLSLLRWLNRGIPLPLGAINNKRSFVGIDNLIDLIISCIDHPAAVNQVFLVSDAQDISTTEMLKGLGKALEISPRLIPISSSLLKMGAQILGKKDTAQRLLGNLQIDISHTKNTLNWKPIVNLDVGLGKTAKWYLNQK